ncbi:hypothetical protein BD410DRAFT_786466 [Rickenella mellea]|uniref:Uncharacterized protein n=1 Tax=Rickenella mellea TaxID=50990 RepID=A0A4Y7QA77_9AGAM|nr:hypothetical protein BD410DRAFT_786466 [Rickenella mellea]
MSSNGDATLKSSDIPAAPHTHTPLTASAAATSVNKNHGMDDTASITSQETNDVFEDAEEFVVTTPSAEEHPELATPKAATNDFSFSSAQSGATITDTHAHMGDATAGNANGAGKSIPLSPEAIAAIPVPPVPIAPPPNPPHGGSEISYSSGSTSTAIGGAGSNTGLAPPRKKSVRVSLQPTFSPTPPAIDYEDDDDEEGEGDGAHPPWSGQKEREKSGWPSREHKTGDAAWEDSSDEDEEYAQARRLLAKVERRMEKVKKRVGGSRRNADD